tara:strand:- start:2668 stop:2790 length:123 start_codon:yes stop_codon:yes gene_type:complete
MGRSAATLNIRIASLITIIYPDIIQNITQKKTPIKLITGV